MQPVGFIDAIKLFFTRYADFQGRSRRSEFWFAALFTGLASGLAAIIPVVGFLWPLAILVPSLAITIRRLHDINKSGWWVLINLVPLVGSILLLVWLATDSAPNNQWGPCPK